MKLSLPLSVAIMLAGVAVPASQAIPKPVCLYEIGVARFTVDEEGHRWLERGLLNALGAFDLQSATGVLESVTVPPEILGRPVISVEAWAAYEHLGTEAVRNFVLNEDAGPYTVGFRTYFLVLPSPDPNLDLGDAVNLSTRGHVTPDGDPMIGGFVIENQHRWVLIRGVGPGLADLDVADPIADPSIVVYKAGSSQFLYFNDDWGQRHDADTIEAVAAQVGAFPLRRGSKDAAYLVELAPGVYTVHLATTGAAGTGMIEIYIVP